MAREYARVKITIWTDPDFRAVSEAAQRLYFLLLTSPSTNLCGVSDWRESRLRALASNSTVDGLRNAAWELGEANLIAIDPDTEEVLIRSFVRHDGVLKSPNMTAALVKDYASIASQKLMALVSRETRRAFDENPDWKGREAALPVTKQFPDAEGNPFEMVPDWFRNGSETVPSETPQKQGNPSKMVPPSLNPHPSASLQVESGAARAPRKRPARTLPDDWQPNDTHRAKATAEGLDLHRAVESFRNHARANDRRLVDWNAGFSNWLAKERPVNSGYRNQNQIMADMRQSAARSGNALALIENGDIE